MFKMFLAISLLTAISLLLLSVRLFFGKKFVHTHIDGNKPLNRQGIRCVKEMDRQARRDNPHRVSEHSGTSVC